MTDRVVTVSGLALGAQGVNSLLPAGFNNPACTVVQNNYFTPLNVKYLAADSHANYIVESTPDGLYRDVEVTTWSRNGYVYLRLVGGKAFYFWHFGEAASGGWLRIGIVTGLNQTAGPTEGDGTYTLLYETDNCVANVPGYDRTDTTGDAFTFGVSGFDVYVKFNGTEFLRFKEYRHMAAGVVALKAQAGYGFRDITLHSMADATLYSNYLANEIDMRDWGLRSIQTTGTIAASSTSLTVASAAGLVVGDFVIVEIGAEAGAGLRGTIGVGGVYPALHYANAATMNADASKPTDTLAWTEDDGNTFQRIGGAWLANASWDASGNGWGGYYTGKAVPLSLQARITAISGTTITLDTAATVAATSATVHLDNQLPFNYLLQTPPTSLIPLTTQAMTLVIPAGSYCLGGAIYGATHDGWTIQGAGQGSTILFSGKGMRCAGIRLQDCDDLTIRDFTLNGNVGTTGAGLPAYYGFKFPTTLTPTETGILGTQFGPTGLIPVLNNSESPITQTSVVGYHESSGITVSSSLDVVVQDMTCNNYLTAGVAFSSCTDAWAYRVTVNLTYSQQAYTQWQMNWVNTTRGGNVDCTINSTYLCAGLESFVTSAGPRFIRPTLINAVLSLNNVGVWSVEDGTITVTAGSSSPNSTPHSGMVQISTNAGTTEGAAGGVMSNMNITIQGYVNANNDSPYGILIGPSNPNVVIRGGSYTAPDYLAPSILFGAHGVDSAGVGTRVTCFTVTGTVPAGTASAQRSNIGITNGFITYCRALVIFGTGGTTTLTGNGVPTDPQNAACATRQFVLHTV